MRRGDARSAQIGGPDTISQCFQVRAYSGEPNLPILTRNLFSKDDWKSALRDEPIEGRPEMPFVSNPLSFASLAERLAGATSGSDSSIIGPSGESESKAPSADPSEEMMLGEPSKIAGQNVFDTSLIHFSLCDCARLYEFTKPSGREGVVFIVISAHRKILSYGIINGKRTPTTQRAGACSCGTACTQSGILGSVRDWIP